MKRVQSTKERILEKACLLFAEHGFESVSTRQIAEEANVRHGSLRYHFESKEALYIHVFREVYDVDNALTYDVLLRKEPRILDTPEGQAYAIQRIVFDYFQRHIFIPDEWKRKFIHRELVNLPSLFRRAVEEELKEEAEKMTEFYFLLRPNGNRQDAFFWAHIPDSQGLFYFLGEKIVDQHFDPEGKDILGGAVVKNTAKLMISFLDLPIPQMLDS